MLFDAYKDRELIWLTTVGAATGSGKYGFRGDFVVKLGALNEAAKKRNPPEAMIREAVMLESDGKLVMVVGNLADVQELPIFIERFAADLDPACRPVFFIDNLKESAVVEVDGRPYALITFSSGMIWNELLELCFLEKSDLKGQDGPEKIETVYEALKGYKPSFAPASLDKVIADRTESKRQAWGAV